MSKRTGVLVAGVVGLAFVAGVAVAAEKDIKIPRVPAAELAKAKEMKNPLKPTADVLAKGKAIFEGKGTCFTCHGNTGKGDGPAGAFRLPEAPGVAVEPLRAEGRKCARSWRILPEVGADPRYPDLSLRDAQAVAAWDAARA